MELALFPQLLLEVLLVGALPIRPRSADWRYYPGLLLGIWVGIGVVLRLMNGF